jgi:hypothetical protein
MPGEEFVDPNFVEKALPTYLKAPMQILFGSNPDRVYLNYRLRQVLRLLHETELDQHVRRFDSRVTYLPFDNDEFVNDVFRPTYDTVSGTSQFLITGEHVGDDGPGITRQQWNVFVESMEEIRVTRRTPPVSEELVTYNSMSNRTGQIPLPGTGLLFEIVSPGIGDEWEVYSTGRPRQGIEVLLPQFANAISATGILDLFGTKPEEPTLTYRNLYTNNDQFAYKYGGLLLAVADVLDKAPQVQ